MTVLIRFTDELLGGFIVIVTLLLIISFENRKGDKKKGIPNGCVFAEYWHQAYKVPHNAYSFPV